MTEKEQLIDLIRGYFIGVGDTFSNDTITSLADYLIANGVKIPVRCEECVHIDEKAANKFINCDGFCDCNAVLVRKTDYCSYGERITDNAAD